MSEEERIHLNRLPCFFFSFSFLFFFLWGGGNWGLNSRLCAHKAGTLGLEVWLMQ
jgi:hypothetical protein